MAAKRTGLVCPACKQSAGVIENTLPNVIVFVQGVRPSLVNARSDRAEALALSTRVRTQEFASKNYKR
jgi:hypothetical protein